jgi:PIN domain nuclease of toxin-antitoxin system
VKVLIDTQCWLWMNVSPERLSVSTRAMLLLPATERILSVASIWEMGINYYLGKLALPVAPSDYVPARLALTMTTPLAISGTHALRASSLPAHHRDPFDRMIVAQSLVEGVSVLSSDGQLDAYGIQRLAP